MKRILFILIAEMSAYLFCFGTIGLQEVSHELQIAIHQPVPQEQRYFVSPEGNLPIQQERIKIPTNAKSEKSHFTLSFKKAHNISMTAQQETVMLHHDEYYVPPERKAA